MRRKNVVRPGDNIESIWKEPNDASFGSYGIGECLDIVERELQKGNGVTRPDGAEWAEGKGVALAMLECGPPTEHRSGAEMQAAAGRHLPSRLRLDRNGQRHHPRRTSRSPHRCWACAPMTIDIINADTDRTPYDTGTFASTGIVVGGKAVHMAAEAMRDDILDFASRHTGVAARPVPARQRRCHLRQPADPADVSCMPTAPRSNHRFSVSRRAYLSPRTIAFNVQGVRLAVHQGDRRNPCAAQRACRRYRPADQPDAVPRPARWRRLRWAMAGRWSRTWCMTTKATW